MALRLGKNFPVAVRGTFIKRAQDFTIGKQRTVTPYFEMGNAASVGSEGEPATYTASLAWFPIDNTVEWKLANKGSGDVTLAEIMAAAAMTVESKWNAITNAVVTGLEYNCQVGSEFKASAQFKGTAFPAGNSALTADTPSGSAVFKARNVVVVVGGAQARRVQGFSLNVQLPSEDNYEMGTDDPVEITTDTPTITLDIDWKDDDLATGQVEPDTDAPVDFTIAIGGTAKRIVIKNCVWTGLSVNGRVKGVATRKLTYTASDATTGGITMNITNTAPSGVTLTPSPASPQAANTAITLTGAATDTDTISKIEFYAGTIKLGTDTSSPYTQTWTPSVAGTYVLKCIAYDLYGAKTASSNVNFTVT